MQFKNLRKVSLQLVAIFIVLAIPAFESNAQQEVSTEDNIKVKVLGHAHMDPVYRWRWNEIEKREIYKTFSDVLKVLDKYPELYFAQSYLLYYETIQKHFPELFKEVQQKIKEQRWSVVGGQWVEPDETLPSGESLIRQFVIAKDYYTKNLGIENIDIAWSPDVFTGHPSTLPKIYAGCGVKNYVFSREAPEGKRIFWWESKDGSRMLGYKIPDHYNPNYREMPNYLKDWGKITQFEPLITIGKGDHGGGPGDAEMRILKRLSSEHKLEFEHTSPEKYFVALHAAKKDWPVHKTEFGYRTDRMWWLGNYTSHAKIKKYNRKLENQLLAAEKFATIGTMYKGKPFFPREDFSKAWKMLLFNQFHDIIPGTLTGLGADDAMLEYKKLDKLSAQLLNNGLENIAARINTEIEGIPLVVFNPHSWPVSQLTKTEIQFIKKGSGFSIKDAAGNYVPFTVQNKSDDGLKFTVELDAKNVPPLGYEVYEVHQVTTEEIKSELKVENRQIENAYYIVKWDEKGISSIYSKKLKKEMLKGTGNQLQLLEDNGSSWGLGLTGKDFPMLSLSEPEVIFNSPVKAVVKWEDYYQSSKFVRYMTVQSNSKQIDFEMKIDWHSGNKLLRVLFPAAIENGEAWFDQAYGYVQREDSKIESPGQKWISYSGKNLGVSLLNNGKNGFTINEGMLTISVVRGARDMNPRMDEGKHSFKYAFIAHESDWRAADIPLKAWEFNQPLIARQEPHHPGPISGWRYKELTFPKEKSFFKIDSDHVIISSIKTKQDAYDPYDVVLRIVETEGKSETVTVHLPHEAKFVEECNHIEETIEPRSKIELQENKFTFEMGHDQIRTFMIKF